ncbi:sigma-70 family RNA polymerase sigma factor [Cohnella endophytica]|uniref:Sigma-70 family RNA polymerase sigma factor n=1 Tax=Cohnella endophytica TaxID=2419778 RepID=A0A494Y4J1_9BACL|nr:sigma-70 family RNA polymerase sigma factor [Cohnella endophytica]RKP56960.1 sigma-70 family RNA polymerase sigma factor [Cohnella endophytica]
MEQAGNLDELYATHSVTLGRFMFKLTRNREEAKDLVHDVFLKLCQQERMPEHPKGWLNLTGYRLFVDQWRRNRRISWTPLDSQAASVMSDPEQAVIDREFDRLVRRLLLRFKPRMRAAIYMRIYKQISYGDIARQLDCSENTVKSYIRRGKSQLSKWM